MPNYPKFYKPREVKPREFNCKEKIIARGLADKCKVALLEFNVPVKAITTNEAYKVARHGRGLYLSDEGKNFKEILGYYARNLRTEMFVGEVELWMEFHFKDKRHRDTDGTVKLTMDAFQGILYKNDFQVRRFHVERFLGQKADVVKFKLSNYEK